MSAGGGDADRGRGPGRQRLDAGPDREVRAHVHGDGAFVHDIEARPLARLVSDLDGLMALPDAKYQLVVMVLRKKVRAGSADREAILARIQELARAKDAALAGRAQAFLAKPAD